MEKKLLHVDVIVGMKAVAVVLFPGIAGGGFGVVRIGWALPTGGLYTQTTNNQ